MMADVALANGEKILAIWRPQLRIYVFKIVMIAAVTALLASPFQMQSYQTWLVLLPTGVIFYLVAFDDFQDWFRHRRDEWTLTNRRLIFFNPTGMDAPATVALSEITKIRLWMFWSLHVHLLGGQVSAMIFLPNRKEIRDQIIQAQDNTKGPNHEQ